MNKDKEKDEECLLCTVSDETIRQLEKSAINKKVDKKTTNQEKDFSNIFLITGILIGLLGIIGFLGLCCISLITSILGIFGINSIVLMSYSKLFSGISIFLIGLFIFLKMKYLKKAENKRNIDEKHV